MLQLSEVIFLLSSTITFGHFVVSSNTFKIDQSGKLANGNVVDLFHPLVMDYLIRIYVMIMQVNCFDLNVFSYEPDLKVLIVKVFLTICSFFD